MRSTAPDQATIWRELYRDAVAALAAGGRADKFRRVALRLGFEPADVDQEIKLHRSISPTFDEIERRKPHPNCQQPMR